MFFVLAHGIHPFLASTEKANANTLVVEGWINPYALRAAAAEFNRGGYDLVISTGTPVVGLGGYVNDFQTSASVGAETLVGLGLAKERVKVAVSRNTGRDRTYSSAIAVREFLRREGRSGHPINVLTENAHGRRTRLLFEKAFGPGASIGVISVANPDYDPQRWWRYSQGVREVVSETAAYLYARLFFWPGPADESQALAAQ